jgi:low temperature requirement protein LtrA
MWWVYFDRPLHDLLTSNRFTFRWGYGHVVIFATTAALGAGLAAAAELADGSVQAPAYVAGAAVGAPVALYLLAVWLLCVRPLGTGRRVDVAFPVAALLCAGAAFVPRAVLIIGLIMAALVALMVLDKQRPASAPA